MINLRSIIFGLAIIILTSFVSIYGMLTFYGESPQYEDYCGKIIPPVYEINTSKQCEELGGKWTNYQYYDKTMPIREGGISGYCDLYYECNQESNEANKIYSRNIFIIAVPVGVILISIGGALFAIEAVGAGIMGGGIVTLIYGSSRYWASAGNAFRFIISLLGLIFVIGLVYWLQNRNEKKSKSFLKNLVKNSKKK